MIHSENPSAWELDMLTDRFSSMGLTNRHGNLTDSSDDESIGSSEDELERAHPDGGSALQLPETRSTAYREFLQFLELGCYDTPVQSYPAIVVVLSTIPPILIDADPSSWTDFLTSFWAALDGRALSLTSTARAAGRRAHTLPARSRAPARGRARR